jgi:hypothetical protein
MNLIKVSNGEAETLFTIDDMKKLRDKALELHYSNFHPRYAIPVANLFAAANAILREMESDEAGSCHSGD